MTLQKRRDLNLLSTHILQIRYEIAQHPWIVPASCYSNAFWRLKYMRVQDQLDLMIRGANAPMNLTLLRRTPHEVVPDIKYVGFADHAKSGPLIEQHVLRTIRLKERRFAIRI